MCLAIPARVVAIEETNHVLFGKVDFGGVSREVCLDHVRDVKIGDYVLVHVGFALARIDEAEAKRIFEFLQGSEDLDDWKAAG
jgi:hydrogenase expression/formation protein HypC